MHSGNNILRLVAFIFLAFGFALGQSTSKPAEVPPKSDNTTTVDAWRQALPESENRAWNPQESEAANSEESFAAVEKTLVELEYAWMEAVKLRDPLKLRQLLAADFTESSAAKKDSPLGKKQYVASALHELTLRSYQFDKLSVRVYPNTVVVDASFSQQASIGEEPWNGSFILTDVWIKQNGSWKAVSRHLSRVGSLK